MCEVTARTIAKAVSRPVVHTDDPWDEIERHLQELKLNPKLKVAIVADPRFVSVVDSWVQIGAPKNHQVGMGRPVTAPVVQIYIKSGKVRLAEVDLDSPEKLSGGIYIIKAQEN